MSGTIVLDPGEMHVAAPRITELHLNLLDAAARLTGLDIGVAMPPGVKAKVVAAVDAARAEVMAGARRVEGLGADVARRAGLAELADTLTTIWHAAAPLSAQLGAITAGSRYAARGAALRGNLDAARMHRDYARRAERLSRLLGAAGRLVGYGPATLADVRNDLLSTDQKVGRTAGRAATGGGVGGLTKLGVGGIARLVGPRAALAAAGPVGIGIGVAWTVLDYKLDLSDRIADGATWAVDKVGDGAQWVDDNALDPAGDFIGDRAEDVHNGVDAVTPWDGISPL